MNKPPRNLKERDPNELMREIEDDPLSQLVWNVGPSISKTVRRVKGRLSSLLQNRGEGTSSSAKQIYTSNTLGHDKVRKEI